MRCPICGSNMKHDICGYCKIESSQVENASNKAVVKARKEGNKHLIHYSSTLPKDVNYMRLLLLTIFFGWCGVGSFYVKKNIRGAFSVCTFFMGALFYALKQTLGKNWNIALQVVYEILILGCAICIIMWVWDFFSLITKNYKVPVVLAEKEKTEKKKVVNKSR